MSSSPAFTIILSGYQTESYLPESLESIANQTFKDFEAICYVEKSTDRSLEVCQAQAAKDPRFKVATAPVSGGVGTTRNYGIDHAAGEYLVVIDGDDRLSVHLLESLAEKLKQTGPLDVIAFAAVTIADGDTEMKNPTLLTNFRSEDEKGVFTGIEALRRAGRNGGQFRAYTWLCAYRTAFLRERKLYQSDGLRMEDFEWAPRVWFAAERFAYIDEVFYVYRRRGNSLTTESSSRLVLDQAHQLRSLLNFAEKTRIPDDLLRIWSNQWLSSYFWFLFHPVSSGKITNRDRRDALQILLAAPGAEQLRKLAARASGPKRAAIPLLRLAAKGFVLPARLYFRLLYSPLNELRSRKRKAPAAGAQTQKAESSGPRMRLK